MKSKPLKFMLKLLLFLSSVGVAGVLVAGAGLVAIVYHYGKDLPNHAQLTDYQPQTSTRVHAGDGSLMGEFAIEKRVFVPIEAIPQQVLNGFVAAEDKNFYTHHGVDPLALARAVIMNVIYYFEGRRLIGASTITQQVAKNFLLTNEVSINRKIKEAILAIRIERSLGKDQIMELYVNEIYLGLGAYGVAAAALVYFDKSLDELETHEIAYLAALPKAPSNYHPVRQRASATGRRNWVLQRMEQEKFISMAQMTESLQKPLINQVLGAEPGIKADRVEAEYFLEQVRRELLNRFGENGLYRGGLSARTSLDPFYQGLARNALRRGLIEYDRRHGYRGALEQLDLDQLQAAGTGWQSALSQVSRPLGNPGWNMAIVLDAQEQYAQIGLLDGSQGTILLNGLGWARTALGKPEAGLGPQIKSVRAVMQRGDVILVEPLAGNLVADHLVAGNEQDQSQHIYALRQIPAINGAIIALDPHTGRILAMVGGFNFDASEFNRATQAMRQTGSAIKPFVYLAALEKGLTPATIILDAPFVLDQGGNLGKWKPSNYSNIFYGPSLMRIGVEKSRNLMTVRLAQAVGMDAVSEVMGRFDIIENMPQQLSMSLGAGQTTLMKLAAAYAELVNGGKHIMPSLIDRVQDRRGNTIYRHDQRSCVNCENLIWQDQLPPKLPDNRTQLTDPIHAYQIVSMLEGAVQSGTGIRLKALNLPLAGKTGTTNESKDSWFMGFSPDLVVGVYTGFDTPISLGRRPNGAQETGSSVALPVFKYFMEEALKDQHQIPFRTPAGVRIVKIDAETGGLPTQISKKIITENFKPGTEPTTDQGSLYVGGATNPNRPQNQKMPLGLY
ncbi:MAG: penicillin-binding protein 1A [Alphaproteobacteria bacterium]